MILCRASADPDESRDARHRIAVLDSTFNMSGYARIGFDFSPYFAVIAAVIAVSFIGTAVRKLVVGRLSAERLRPLRRDYCM
jgi:hypothetical protein